MSKPLLVLIRVHSIDPTRESAVRGLLVSWSRPALYVHVCLRHSGPFRAFFYKVKSRTGATYFQLFLPEIKANEIYSGAPR